MRKSSLQRSTAAAASPRPRLGFVFRSIITLHLVVLNCATRLL